MAPIHVLALQEVQIFEGLRCRLDTATAIVIGIGAQNSKAVGK